MGKGKIIGFLTKIFGSRKRVVVFLVLVFVLMFAGWRFRGSEEEGVQFQTASVERGMIISSVSASGQVLSVNVMSANTKASGIVSKVYVKDGQTVKKGDKILEIELDFQGEQKKAQTWSSYLSAQNGLESAKATAYSLQAAMFGKWDTFKELAEGDEYDEDHIANRNLPEYHIPEKEWLSAEAKYKNQAAVISQAQVALNSSWLSYVQTSPVVTAPISGILTSLMYAEGMSIGTLDTGSTTSNQKVAMIKTEGMPIVSVNLSEIDVSQVQSAQKATITLDSLPDKTFTGEVVGVDRIGQTTSGVTQYPAILRLDSAAAEILPNMTAAAAIMIDRKDNCLLVPSGAIQEQSGQTYARVLMDGEQQFVPVETGLASDTQIEIVSGLDEGDLVVTGTLTSADSQQNGSSLFGGGMGGMMRMSR